ncbi:MAG: cobalamin-binding protein, partial [Nocardioidaceae bacterium]|nr:cobalamin-binding protein [Nocardioidaceae bacterium]
GIPVWVTRIESVPEAITSMRRLLTEALQVAEPAWLTEAAARWGGAVPARRATVAVAVWRDPWMVVGRDTFTGDLLARAGLANIYAEHPARYPTLDVGAIDTAGADVVLLPDEPYPFTSVDGPESFAETRTRLVSGRLLTWYGPALVAAHDALHEIC